MNQRRETRFTIDQPVTVTVLGDHPVEHPARVKNASGRGLALELEDPVPPGAALKIQFDDSIVLGEAVYCRAAAGSYFIGVELDQMLCSLSQLGRKLQEFAALDKTADTASEPRQ